MKNVSIAKNCVFICLILWANNIFSQTTFTNNWHCKDNPLNKNLIGLYTFNGDLKDHSGNGNHFIQTNGAYSKDRFGGENGSLKAGLYSISNLKDTSVNLTISFWLKYNDLQSSIQNIISSIRLEINIANSGKFKNLKITDRNISISSIYDLEPDKWYNITITSKLNELKLYINGKLDVSNIGITNLNNYYSGFGLGSANNTTPFNGLIDDLRILQSTLQDEEVATLYGYKFPLECNSNNFLLLAPASAANYNWSNESGYTNNLQNIVYNNSSELFASKFLSICNFNNCIDSIYQVVEIDTNNGNMTLSGTVWIEDDSNSSYSFIESRLANIKMQLYQDGNLIDSTLTNGNGNYYFRNLKDGDYVVFVFPDTTNNSGKISCLNQSGDDDIDHDDNGSDQYPIKSVPIHLTCKQEPQRGGFENTTIDFCLKSVCKRHELAANSCEEIFSSICDLRMLDSECNRTYIPTTIKPASWPQELCRPGATPHNMIWYEFTAGVGNYEIGVYAYDCYGIGRSAQIGVFTKYEDCFFDQENFVFCDSDCIKGSYASFIKSDLLIPGVNYYLWIDGCGGAVCSYDIKIYGDYYPFQIPKPENLNCKSSFYRCDTLCSNQSICLSVAEYQNYSFSAKYTWEVTDPNGTTKTFYTNMNAFNYSVENTTGKYKIKLVSVVSDCSQQFASIEYSFTVVNPEDESFGIWPVCQNELAIGWIPPGVYNSTVSDPNNDGQIGWFGQDLLSEGHFVKNITTPNGCKHKQEVSIVKLNNSQPFYLDTLLCPGQTIKIGPYVIKTETETPLQLSFENKQKCDSIVIANISYVDNNDFQNLKLTASNNNNNVCPNEEVVFDVKGNFIKPFYTFYWSIEDSFGIIKLDTTFVPRLKYTFPVKTGLYKVTLVKITSKCGSEDFTTLSTQINVEKEETCNKLRYHVDTFQSISCSIPGFIHLSIEGGISPIKLFMNDSLIDINDTLFIYKKGFQKFLAVDSVGFERAFAIWIGETLNSSQYDLAPHFTTQVFNRGFITNAWLDITNESCLSTNALVSMKMPQEIEFISSNPLPSSFDTLTNTYQWHIADLLTAYKIKLQFKTRMSVNIGSTIKFVFETTPTENDFNVQNNNKEYDFMVMGSFDPNDIMSYPSGKCEPNYLSNSQQLSYVIRFQNIGNYPAQDVYIKDSLSNAFDLNSLNIVSSSHPNYVERKQNNILQFNFSNINLPPKSSNEEGSNGYIIFGLKFKNGIQNNTVVKNKAGIIFDFNTPVYTNELTHTIIDDISIIDALEIPITSDGKAIFAPSGYDNYSWLDCVSGEEVMSSKSNEFTPFANGTYKVKIDYLGCEVFSDCISFTTGLIDEKYAREFNFSPNPTSGLINVIINSLLSPKYTVSIRDVLGNKIYSKSINQNSINFEIDLSEFSNGIYFLEYVNSGRKLIQKIILQNR